mgnify:CR=1 FL=1
MRRVFWLVIIFVITGCTSTEKDTTDDNRLIISTEPEKENREEPELESFLLGEWLEVDNTGSPESEAYETSKKETTWVFGKGEVSWGRFTHQSIVSNDTLYIAGSPYIVASELKDTMLFSTAKSNQLIQLVRR